MPTYEYQCNACGYVFEREQRMSDAAIRKCPRCGKLQVKRLIGTGNFILKGGGWYADGYGKASSSSKPDDKSTGKSESSETKTAPASPKPTGEKTT